MGHIRRDQALVAVVGLLVAACAVQPGVESMESERTTTDEDAADSPAPIDEPPIDEPPIDRPSDEPTAGPAPTTTSMPPVDVATETGPVEFGSCDGYAPTFEPRPGPEWECGTLAVPLDHAAPAGESIELAVTRRAGSRSRGEALVINPGGPGAPGLPFVWSLGDRFPVDVLRSFDVVAWDPRGVGSSEPAITCPRGTRWDDDELLARCGESVGDLMAHISTPHHVDDLDALRTALGNERLHYVGYSYGTFIGAQYANRFPDRVGRFVLDGAVHPDAGTLEAPRFDGEPWYAADEVAIVEERFFELCDAAEACGLGDDSNARFQDLASSIGDLPTEGYPGEDRLDAATLDAVLATSMFDPFNWGLLSSALEDAAAGDASTLDALADLLEVSNAYFGDIVDPETSNETLANLAIYCADFQPDPATTDYCDDVPSDARSGQPIGPVDLDHPILVIGTAFDPQTPGRHARELADRLGDAVDISWDGVGHTAFPFHSFCIDDAVTAYLLDDVVPVDGMRCEFVTGLDDDVAVADHLFALPPDYVEPWIEGVLAETWGDDAACAAERLSEAGDQVVVQVILGVTTPLSTAALDEAVASCSSG